MTESPRRMARIAGVLYLLTILTGVFAQFFVSGRLVVDDPATTASNILTHKQLFQLSFTVYLVEMACQVAMTSLFYNLLEPVSRSVSLLAAFFGLVGCTIKTLGRLFYVAPLLVLGNTHYSSVFKVDQLQALSLLSLEVNDQAAGMALAFFGLYALLTGFLIIRSTFLPRFLGVLSMIGGVGWLTYLSPPLGGHMFRYIAPVGLLGALAMVFWLIVVGLNEERWNEQARAAGH